MTTLSRHCSHDISVQGKKVCCCSGQQTLTAQTPEFAPSKNVQIIMLCNLRYQGVSSIRIQAGISLMYEREKQGIESYSAASMQRKSPVETLGLK